MKSLALALLARVVVATGARCGCCGEAPAQGEPRPELAALGLAPQLALTLCRACMAGWPPPWQHQGEILALWPYRGTVRRLLVQAKDEAHSAPAHLLLSAATMSLRQRQVPSNGRNSTPASTWMMVPPSRRRRWRAWYLPQFLGKSLAAQERARWRPRLRRERQVHSQSGLNGEERRRNLKWAFRVSGTALPSVVTVLDDVTTTGASLREAKRALRQAGVTKVALLAIAVVP